MDKGDRLLKWSKAELKHIFTKDVKFRIRQSTQKLRFYTIMPLRIWSLSDPYFPELRRV